MKKVVVFDLDDTLYKEIDFLKSAYREIAMMLERNYSQNNAFDFLLKAYYRGENVFEAANNAFNIEVPLIDYLAIYRNHIPKISLAPTTCEVLDRLKREGVYLGILTDGRTVTQTNKIRSLGLDRYIPVENWIISESVGYEKPSQKGYLSFQDKYTEEASFYYVGDNTSKDFKAPNELKWKSVCLLDNGSNIHKQDFTQSSDMLPTYIIRNILDLSDHI